MSLPLCKDCLYWVSDNGKEGDCRIHPPAHLGSNNRGIWPVTLYNQGCGDALPLDSVPDDGKE